MTIKLTASEARAKIFSLLDEVAAAEEVEITRHGRTVARLVPAIGPRGLKGALVGVAITTAKEEDLFTTAATWHLG